jgi:dethiobiotin synthetase
MQQGFFITGTDTNVGKTWVTVALMRYFRAQGKTVAGMKPVAAGCSSVNGKLINQDALLLQENASIPLVYDEVNPYAFELSVSPHLAAAKAGRSVDIKELVEHYERLQKQVDILLVEGAGGWLAPLNETQDIADLACSFNLPIIIVVAIRLGCINHAKLTYQAVCLSGLQCAGWIAACTEAEMPCREENILTIDKVVAAPLLGIIPYCENADFDMFAMQLRID